MGATDKLLHSIHDRQSKCGCRHSHEQGGSPDRQGWQHEWLSGKGHGDQAEDGCERKFAPRVDAMNLALVQIAHTAVLSLNGSLARGMAIKLRTAVSAIWTRARFIASTRGANLLIKITCNAQAIAHPMTRNSPRPKVNWKELLTEMSASPATEKMTPSILPRVGF